MFPMAYGEDVVRERRRLVLDPYSNEQTLADWSDPDKATIEGVAIAPSSSTEPLQDDRRQVITRMSIYCAPGSDVRPADRIRARTGLWEVVGEIADWHNPFTGWNPGVEFELKKVMG